MSWEIFESPADSSLVTKENVGSLDQVGAYLRWYQKNGGLLHAWHLYRFLAVGRGGRLHDERFSTGEGVFEAVGAELKARFEDLRIYLRPDMYHSKDTSFYWWQAGEMKTLSALHVPSVAGQEQPGHGQADDVAGQGGSDANQGQL